MMVKIRQQDLFSLRWQGEKAHAVEIGLTVLEGLEGLEKDIEGDFVSIAALCIVHDHVDHVD